MSEIDTQVKTCEFGEIYCGQYYDCGKCTRKRRAEIYKKMTPEQKAYDCYVDPLNAYHTDFAPGCTCHINPPCSYCTKEVES